MRLRLFIVPDKAIVPTQKSVSSKTVEDAGLYFSEAPFVSHYLLWVGKMKGDTCFPSFLLVDFLECLNFLIIVGSHFNYFS